MQQEEQQFLNELGNYLYTNPASCYPLWLPHSTPTHWVYARYCYITV